MYLIYTITLKGGKQTARLFRSLEEAVNYANEYVKDWISIEGEYEGDDIVRN